jgi:S1-C subfamily serine protease
VGVTGTDHVDWQLHEPARADAVPMGSFCTACGSPSGFDGCPMCSAVTDAEAPRAEPRAGARAVILVGALVVLAALVTVALGASELSRRDLDAMRQELAVEHGDRDRQAETIATLNSRLGAAEARAALSADPVTLAKAASPSVFTVEAGHSLGSAFVVASDDTSAQLVTNFHVIASEWLVNRTAVTIRHDGSPSIPGTVVSADAGADLAVVKVDGPLPVLRINRSEPVVGAPVVVLGSPLGLDGTVTDGIVSALRSESGIRRIQVSAPISPGNSGGPVLDRDGAVIGVSVSKDVADGAEGLGFAVPAAQLCDVLHLC